jgi:hypothetical protein
VDVSPVRRAGAQIALIGAGFLAFECAEGTQLDDTLRDADMLVFVVEAAETADQGRMAAIATIARDRGLLVAALVVGEDRTFGRSPLLAALRDAADMVMIVRERDAVAAVVAALR